MAAEVEIEVPVLLNVKNLAKGEELTVFRPPATVKKSAAAVSVTSLLKKKSRN